jgi:ABC-2 type transport system ATP-binding protein
VGWCGFGRSGDAWPGGWFLAWVVPGLPVWLTEGSTVIEVEKLSKQYGDKLAVDGLEFVVRPGMVTGFLGPNGAGKSTTMRMIAGLDEPATGRVRVNGRNYRAAAAPMAELGILLEARAVHTGRSARNHLLALAQTNGVSRRRVDELIEMVGLGEVATKRVGGFSLGMGQRLGIAAALLGDPSVVVLDEPVNGLDPEGVLWIRNLLKSLAAEGRTVFVSSHLMSEMALTATRLVVVGRGRLIADTTVEEFVALAGGNAVRVRTPAAHDLRELLLGPDVTVTSEQSGVLHVQGLTAEQVGTAAWRAHLPIFDLTTQHASLEEAFMKLTDDSVDFRSHEVREAVAVR